MKKFPPDRACTDDMDLSKLLPRSNLLLLRGRQIHTPNSPVKFYYTYRCTFTKEDDEFVEDKYNGRVGIFWDLDNKPPNSVPPYNAAMRLKTLAANFGNVTAMVAYANRHAFTFVPDWVRSERRQRKTLDFMEMEGVIRPVEPYVCEVCGRRFETNPKFVKHFKQLHEREHNKRLARLECLKGKRKELFRAKVVGKEDKYRNAANRVLVPKVGYGLAREIIRAGFRVRTVRDKPQAADVALENDVVAAIGEGMRMVCLVSDDSDFARVLRKARESGVRTAVVGDRCTSLMRFADKGFSWRDVVEGVEVEGSNRGHDKVLREGELGYRDGKADEDDDLVEGSEFENGDDDFDEFFRVDEGNNEGFGGRREAMFVPSGKTIVDGQRKAGVLHRINFLKT